jgi:hypothetical protein
MYKIYKPISNERSSTVNGVKNWIGPLIILCLIVFGSTKAPAYVTEGPCVDIDNSDLKVSAFINSSEIDYEIDSPLLLNDTIEAERKSIGFNVTKRYNPEVDVYGAFGYLFDGDDLDSGTYLSGGVRYMVHKSGRVSYHVSAQFDYIFGEEYSSEENGLDIDFDMDGYELSIGGAVRYQKDDNFSAFAGISFVPLSDLSYDLKLTGNLGSATSDGEIERDDKFGFKVGGNYLIDKNWSICGEVDFMSEKAFLISVGRKF